MILRKPYAFLIKQFKKIHLLLGILMAYLAYQSTNLLNFFNDVISTGSFLHSAYSLGSTYINIFIFFVSILVAGIALIIYILMRQKNKPKLLYIIIIGSYIGLIIYFFQMYGVLETLEISAISPRDIRIVRDISTLVTYIQYVLIVLVAIRAFGFNIKKFNFGEDLAELQIEMNDNEEFELTVGVDQSKIGRRLRRGKREVKYFIVENAFVLSLILFFVITTLGVIAYLNLVVYNRIYEQSESFKVGYFVNKINGAYYTHLNQRGVKIAPEGKVYIVTNIMFTNVSNYNLPLTLDNINLVSDKSIFAPTTKRYQSFLDLGEGYIEQEIKGGESKSFIIVFEVDENTDLGNLLFRYRESLDINAARLEAKYKKIKLDITSLDNIEKVNEAKLNKDLVFTNSDLGNTKFKVSDVQIEDQFIYDATSCYGNICNTTAMPLTLQYQSTQKLMKLSFTYNKDTSARLPNSNNLLSLINTYGSIRYTVGSKINNVKLIDKTPTNYNGKDMFFQVPSSLKEASSIEIVFCIRNKEYIYKLK